MNTKVNLINAIMSHLSDAQVYAKINEPKKAVKEINIAKAILLYIADEKTGIGRMDVDTEEIDNMLKRVLNV